MGGGGSRRRKFRHARRIQNRQRCWSASFRDCSSLSRRERPCKVGPVILPGLPPLTKLSSAGRSTAVQNKVTSLCAFPTTESNLGYRFSYWQSPLGDLDLLHIFTPIHMPPSRVRSLLHPPYEPRLQERAMHVPRRQAAYDGGVCRRDERMLNFKAFNLCRP